VPVLGVDVGSTRLHMAIARDGRAELVLALDGLPYIPSVVGYTDDHALVGAPARAHFFVSPGEVLFSPARHLGGAPVKLGAEEHEPESLVACLLGQAGLAAEALAGAPVDGLGLSRAAWATPEARRALAAAAQGAGMHLVRTEVSTSLAALAHLADHGPTGLGIFIDVGGWKIEATVLQTDSHGVRALGRSVDATIGANWLDGRLVKALAHEVAGDNERALLKDRLCYAMLREQCEAMRIELSTEQHVDVSLPFLAPLLGSIHPPSWRLERAFLDLLAQPLVDAVAVVCAEALEHAKLRAHDLNEVLVVGGLAHMPLVRDTISAQLGMPVSHRGELDGLAAQGAALIAAASLGQLQLRLIDDLDEHGHSVAAAGWGQVIPPPVTPAPEVLPLPPPRSVTPSPERQQLARPRSPAPEAPQPSPLPTPAPGVHAPPRTPKATPPPLPRTAHASTQGPAHVSRATPPPLPRASHPSSQDLQHAEYSAPARAARATPAHPPHGHEPTLPSEGEIRNARTPAELAAVPLEGALPLTPPLSLPVLLLALGRRRSFSGQLRLASGNHEVTLAIVRGGGAGTSVDLEQLRRAFEWTEGHYRLSAEAPPARLVAMRQSMVGLVVHGLRSHLRILDITQVLDVLAPHLQNAPRVMPGRAAILPLLGLSPREQRFVDHVLDGVTSADEILRRGGIGRETAVHIMFVLHVFRALEWLSVQERPGESPADQLRLRAHKMEKADHFEALGVHWSVARGELDRALRRIEEDMRPGGPASTLDPEAAARILDRARQAHAAVCHEGDRHAYLLAIHPDIDFESIESVAEDQNQWYAYRGAYDASQETARLKKELLELSRLQHTPSGKPQR
jgi:hypothetical protein